MRSNATLGANGRTITVCILMLQQRRRHRKMIVGPESDQWSPPRPRLDAADNINCPSAASCG